MRKSHGREEAHGRTTRSVLAGEEGKDGKNAVGRGCRSLARRALAQAECSPRTIASLISCFGAPMDPLPSDLEMAVPRRQPPHVAQHDPLLSLKVSVRVYFRPEPMKGRSGYCLPSSDHYSLWFGIPPASITDIPKTLPTHITQAICFSRRVRQEVGQDPSAPDRDGGYPAPGDRATAASPVGRQPPARSCGARIAARPLEEG